MQGLCSPTLQACGQCGHHVDQQGAHTNSLHHQQTWTPAMALELYSELSSLDNWPCYAFVSLSIKWGWKRNSYMGGGWSLVHQMVYIKIKYN